MIRSKTEQSSSWLPFFFPPSHPLLKVFFLLQSHIQIHLFPSLVLGGKSLHKLFEHIVSSYMMFLPIWLLHLRIGRLALWSQWLSKCCVLQLAECGLAQTSLLGINSLFAATDTNPQSGEFVCLVKKGKKEEEKSKALWRSTLFVCGAQAELSLAASYLSDLGRKACGFLCIPCQSLRVIYGRCLSGSFRHIKDRMLINAAAKKRVCI